MLRICLRGLFLALVVGCVVPAFAAKPPAKPAPAPASAPGPRVAPLSPEAMVEAMQAEKDAYTRRLDVCTQLRRIAAETNDSKLETEALQLEQLAETTYKQRVAKLGVKSERSLSPSLEAFDRSLGTSPSTGRATLSGQSPSATSGPFREVKP